MSEPVKYRVSCFKRFEGESCAYEDNAGAMRCAQQLQINIPHGESFGFSLSYDTPKARSCHLAYFREKDETAITNMATTHPITWNLIHDRLDGLYNIFDSGYPQTNREKAASLINEGATDWQMFPHFLVGVGDQKCGEWRYKKIPFATVQSKSPLPSDFYFPTELKQCTASGKYEKDPILQDYTFDIAMDRNCFWNSLATFIPQTPYHPPLFPSAGPVEILDLGCGIASGAFSLVSYFEQYRDSLGTSPLQVQYTGVDVNKREIEKARRINPQNFNFVVGGAIEYLTHQVPQKEFDVVLLRHPGEIRNDWVDDSVMWAEIMHQAYLHLSENGIMIVTNYYCNEYHFSKDLLGNILGAQIYVAGQNPSAFQGLGGSHTRDAYIIIAGKQPH